MGCPHCEALLRIPAEMIGREVVCKLCDATFLAEPAQADGRPTRAEAEASSGRIPSLERDLARILAEHAAIRSELGRLRAESDDLSRRERREIEAIRAQVERLASASARPEREREPAGTSPFPRPAAPAAAMPAPRRPAHVGGPGRIATAPPGRKPQGAAGSKAGGGVSLRELLERLAGCEAMTDRLIARLKSEQERRHEDRTVFATVLERLQGELTRARQGFATGRGEPDESAERDGPPAKDSGSIAMPARLPEYGVA
jgi:hypothetical protein